LLKVLEFFSRLCSDARTKITGDDFLISLKNLKNQKADLLSYSTSKKLIQKILIKINNKVAEVSLERV